MSLVGIDEYAETDQMQTTSGLSTTVQSKDMPRNSILNFFRRAEPNRIEKRKNEETTPADVKRKIMNAFQLKTVETKSIVSISKSTTSDPIKHGSDKHMVTNEPKITKKFLPMSLKAHSNKKVLDIG